jgi:Tol biopolymer transport system component
MEFSMESSSLWFAILAEPVPGSGDSSLYISDGNGHELLAPLNINNSQELAWSPDGKTLALTEPTGDIALLSFQQKPSGQLISVQTRILHAWASDIGNLAWSPSGRWLVCRHASYNSEDYLFLLATDGSGKQVQITSSTTDGQLDFPAWSPDGKQLVVAQIAITGNTLMTFNIEQVLKEKGIQP